MLTVITIGNPDRTALRMTMGKLTRRGKFHRWLPCVFLIYGGRRRVG